MKSFPHSFTTLDPVPDMSRRPAAVAPLPVFDAADLLDLVADRTRVASKQSVGEPRIVILAGHELAALLDAAGCGAWTKNDRL